MKKVLLVLSAIILLAAGCSKSQTLQQSPQAESSINTSATSALTQQRVQNDGQPNTANNNVFVGILETSDNFNKGNLMLAAQVDPRSTLSKNTILYIKTQRDYSSLIGKKVLAAFNFQAGSNYVNNFSLIDIVEDVGQSSFPK